MCTVIDPVRLLGVRYVVGFLAGTAVDLQQTWVLLVIVDAKANAK